MAYQVPTLPSLRGPLASEVIRDEFGKIATELGLYPTTTGSGTQGFTGGKWTGAVLDQPTLIGGIIGSTAKPATAVTGFHIFNKTVNYTSLNAGLVGLVRAADGKLRLLDGPVVKLFTDDAHNLVMGTGVSEMAATSGGGFFYLSTVNALATGAPTTYTGAAPMVFDRAANKLGIYNAGAWKWTGLALTGSAVYDPASLADGVGVTTTIAVAGAALGNYVTASFSLDLQGVILFAWVSAAGTVSIRFQNESGGVIDLASGTISVAVRNA